MITKFLHNNVSKYHKHRQEFHSIFHKPLSSFHDFLTGFHLTQFDDFLKTPDGFSMKDCVLDKYGPRAVEIIKDLI